MYKLTHDEIKDIFKEMEEYVDTKEIENMKKIITEGPSKPLEILVVDDREENIMAAKKAFNKKNLIMDYANDYEQGLTKLQTKPYALGIFDLELPRRQGEKPEKLGFGLAEEAKKYYVDWAIITAGIDHHNCKSAFVKFHYDSPKKEFEEITEGPKSDPATWYDVYTRLVLQYPGIEQNFESRKRCKEITGKMYRR